MVKKREAYRPFAPSVLEERAGEFFVLPAVQKSWPYMTVIVEVQPDKRALLGAVTHVDGTARIQTVGGENPKYRELIEAFDRLTGVPILLNTSFNNHAEPIVDSLADAIGCFLTTGLDYLVAGNWLVSKRPVPVARWLDLVLTPAPTLALRSTRAADGRSVCEAAFGYHHGRAVRVSDEMFDLLRRADGTSTLAGLASGRVESGRLDALARELVDLWTVRMVTLEPVTTSAAAPSTPATRSGRG